MKNIFLLTITLFVFSCTDRFEKLPKEIGNYFKTHLHDPSSFELVGIESNQFEWVEYELYFSGVPKDLTYEEYLKHEVEIKKIKEEILKDEKDYPILHKIEFRATNSFGAKTLHSKYCLTLPGGNLIECYDDYDSYANGIYDYFYKPKIRHLFQK
jgi:hypothetical protein